MQIQKGIVKYKDRSDIVCTYGLTDDGKQYYFLDGGTITNGNIIASTVLVEAIDPVVVASSVGVIDSNGNVVIPFENKSIKLISDELLLVEKAKSTTPSVVEAISLRSDPLAATKLVTTPATIKDKMNAKMGSEGRFVFNDQFSEATICDINGNNLINDEYFSFIGIKNNDTLYFSKNTVDSPITEFSLNGGMITDTSGEVSGNEPLDVQNIDVTQDVIDNAMSVKEDSNMNSGFVAGDITAKDFESVVSEAVEDNSDIVEDEQLVPESVSQADESEEPIDVIPVAPKQDVAEEGADSDGEVVGGSEEQAASTEENDFLKQENVSESAESVTGAEVENDELISANILKENKTDLEQSEESTVESVSDDTYIPDELVSLDFSDNINYNDMISGGSVSNEVEEDIVSDYKNDLFDVDLDSDIFAESMLKVDTISLDDNYMDLGYTSSNSTKDTILEDVATTMSNLISLNRTQRQKIAVYEDRFEQVAATHKKVVEKARGQIREIEGLKAKLKNYETIVNKLEGKLQVLEGRVHEQEKLIANQTRELESLRPQIEGKEELVKILADAQSLLDQVA